MLVVDDEPDTADFLRRVLSKDGYQVTVLTDPTRTVDTLRETDFHLLLLDLLMPRLSGVEVLELVRREDSDLAVIVATAFPSVDTAVASLKLAASDYVSKPVEPAVLLEAVRATLARKGITKDPEAELHRTIGRTVREGRARQHLTLRQLARRTGLSVSLLSQIERAESSPSISSLHRIASALKVPVGDLFGER